MTHKEHVTELVRMSVDLEGGEDPAASDAILRGALTQALFHMAHAVQKYDPYSNLVFSMAFPMEIVISSHKLHWDMHLKVTVQNALHPEEES